MPPAKILALIWVIKYHPHSRVYFVGLWPPRNDVFFVFARSAATRRSHEGYPIHGITSLAFGLLVMTSALSSRGAQRRGDLIRVTPNQGLTSSGDGHLVMTAAV
jgi:hypothetical protein